MHTKDHKAAAEALAATIKDGLRDCGSLNVQPVNPQMLGCDPVPAVALQVETQDAETLVIGVF